ncbi:endonuclease [Pedobacter hiemivivus]|uniref:Endonuclease n=1 Tax=Pedobacter hiemivivus TaxID=2530454 RepID=A0A4U1G2Y9_9SPHI|nr:endonuclease/exonuclease/phosphatase family protein [Pedobacter hiemivivus]TKC57564.1 endonuclease [Pedobacter hiemivivus]
MKKYIILLLIFISFAAYSQNVTLGSWNIQNFGKSKNDDELAYIAKVVNKFDVIAIQEVVAGYGGSQAVARLADELNRMGSKWDYVISNPTSSPTGSSKERYAFVWNTSKVKKNGTAWLEETYGLMIDREPYYCRFTVGRKTFTVANFHAVPKSKQPETEIKYFKFLPDLYPGDNLIFCGDFNLPQSHSVFNPLWKTGHTSAFKGQKTSLKQKCVNGNCLASEYDNFYFKASGINVLRTGIVHFYQDFEDLRTARLISDHVPIYMQFSLDVIAK